MKRDRLQGAYSVEKVGFIFPRVRFNILELKSWASWLCVYEGEVPSTRHYSGIWFAFGVLGINHIAIRRKFWTVAASKNSSWATTEATQSQLIKLQDALEMSEQHFDLLSILA